MAARVRTLGLALLLLAAAPAEARRTRRELQASGGGATMIGGRPPKEIVLATCNIMDLFSHLTAVTTDPDCNAGRDGGRGPPVGGGASGDRIASEPLACCGARSSSASSAAATRLPATFA